MKFEKWQALGNDYAIVEAAALPWELTAERVRAFCEPHFGVGADGILLLSPGDVDVVANLRIFNPDGSEAELSGNGAREAAMYLRRSGWTEADEFAIGTPSGVVRPKILDERTCAMEIGRASTSSADFPSGGSDGRGIVSAAGREFSFQHVSIGNPQCVIDVGDEVEAISLEAYGQDIEHSNLFPNRTNVSFIRIEGSNVRARIWERGVGETLSSGTGASGAAIAAFLRGSASPIAVNLDGGELEVAVSDNLDVLLTGWAERVYAGELSDALLKRLA
ncbi:MAG: diaminopimelate epimerase [Solirubrobacterales bacterium]|nr:diaminopimelate epimerase [Solirubrobacterales bacterium]